MFYYIKITACAVGKEDVRAIPMEEYADEYIDFESLQGYFDGDVNIETVKGIEAFNIPLMLVYGDVFQPNTKYNRLATKISNDVVVGDAFVLAMGANGLAGFNQYEADAILRLIEKKR